MLDHTIESIGRIKHPGTIYSLALSRDETLLACGGDPSHPVVVWRLSDGARLGCYSGLPHQAHSLAFSADGKRLAAINLWGGMRVWSLSDGSLLEARADGASRRHRALAYNAAAPDAILPMDFADRIDGDSRRCPTPDGRLVASVCGQHTLRVSARRKSGVLASLDLIGHAETRSGTWGMAWSADARQLAIAGRGWLGVWAPRLEATSTPSDSPRLPLAGPFCVAPLPSAELINALAIMGGAQIILIAQQERLLVYPVPTTPATLITTPWQRILQAADRLVDSGSFPAKNCWQWNTSTRSYEGIRIETKGLLFYGDDVYGLGGSAVQQGFADFLSQGPVGGLVGFDDAVLAEVVQRVREIVGSQEPGA